MSLNWLYPSKTAPSVCIKPCTPCPYLACTSSFSITWLVLSVEAEGSNMLHAAAWRKLRVALFLLHTAMFLQHTVLHTMRYIIPHFIMFIFNSFTRNNTITIRNTSRLVAATLAWKFPPPPNDVHLSTCNRKNSVDWSTIVGRDKEVGGGNRTAS
jgi:hypothetical protein